MPKLLLFLIFPLIVLGCQKTQASQIQKSAMRSMNSENRSSIQKISTAGLQLAENLSRSQFVCNLDPTETQVRGIQCKGRFGFYPEPVRIFFASNFSLNAEIVFFFHGFETSGDVYQINSMNTLGFGDFGARLMESRNDHVLLVVPESRGKGHTYQLFQDSSGKLLNSFIDEAQRIANVQFSKISLAGHSGGYLPIRSLLQNPGLARVVKKVALFDATYEGSLSIADWYNEFVDASLRVSWTQSGEVVHKTKVFVSRIKNKNNLTLVPSSGSHMNNIRLGGFADFLKMKQSL